MELERKHITPYLPHKVLFINNELKTLELIGIQGELILLNDNTNCVSSMINAEEWKPILRPLSDLTKEIEHNGETFVPTEEYSYISEFLEELSFLDHTYIGYVQYKVIVVLLELHVDINNLIENGLAIDINTIK